MPRFQPRQINLIVGIASLSVVFGAWGAAYKLLPVADNAMLFWMSLFAITIGIARMNVCIWRHMSWKNSLLSVLFYAIVGSVAVLFLCLMVIVLIFVG